MKNKHAAPPSRLGAFKFEYLPVTKINKRVYLDDLKRINEPLQTMTIKADFSK